MKSQVSIYSIFALLICLFLSAAAIAAPGDPDPSFSQDGKFTDPVGGGISDYIRSIAVQPDGKIIGIGLAPYGLNGNCGVVRYNPDGSLDASFDGDGKKNIKIISECSAVAIQSDGKIVLAGSARVPQGFAVAVGRLNPDGSFDNSFDGDGVVTTVISGSYNKASSVAIQTDGKIIIGGWLQGNSYNDSDLALVRYNGDGSLDTSFNGSGKIKLGFSGDGFEGINALAIQPDGKIVASGTATNSSYVLMRFNSDGSFDTSFDGDGKVMSPIADYVKALVLQPDGKIIVGGSTHQFGGSSGFLLLRYNPDGSLDTSFDGDGRVMSLNDGFIFALALQPDGKIAAAGTASYYDTFGNGRFILARYNADGSPDQGFGQGGFVTPTISGELGCAYSIAIQTDGKVVAGGGSVYFDQNFTIKRYNSDGSPDTSFDGDGQAWIDFSVPRSSASSVAIQPDGKIVAGGWSYDYQGKKFTLVRYNVDGTRDTSFGTGGLVKTNPFTNSYQWERLNKILVQPDGKILIIGNVVNFSNRDVVLLRYNPDGSLDTSFSTYSSGIEGWSLGPNDSGNSLALQSNGKIVIGGGTNFNSDINSFLVRYTPDGRLDTSFEGQGVVLTDVSGHNSVDSFAQLAVQPDDKIVGVGSTNDFTDNHIIFTVVRYNSNGSLDTSFNGSGKVLTRIGNSNSQATGVKIQPDGKIIVAGYGSDSAQNYQYKFELVRYNPDGSLDTSFDNDGVVSTNVSDFQCTSPSLALQSNGKIMVAGTCGNKFALVRYNPDGSLDNSYGTGGKSVFNFSDGSVDSLNDMALDSTGRAVVAGDSDGFLAVARVLGGSAALAAAPNDFDGDGKTDLGIYRASAGEWWINRSSTGATVAAQFGNSSDRIVPGDFTGDGKTDIAVWRPATGEWFILRSEDGSFYSAPFGSKGDVPVAADFDGDGKADLAVYRPSSSTWYINKSTGGYQITAFGTTDDIPVVGDYDGDHKADVAIYRPSTGEWWIQKSSTALAFVYQFGNSTDKPVQGDYTGDGKTDVAVWRPSTGEWFVQRSEDSSFYSVPFGTAGDIPAPGDYDGDGKFDTAVFRPSGSTWYINRSTSGLLITAFGISTDKPVPSAFVP